MKIVVTDEGIPLNSVFKLVWTGYAVAVSVIFVPLASLGAIGVLVFGGDAKEVELVFAPFLVLAMATGQALIIGVIVVFGLAVFSRFRRIEIHRPSDDGRGA